MTLKVILQLQAFSNAIRRTFVQYFARFQVTVRLRSPSVTAGLVVFVSEVALLWKKDYLRKTACIWLCGYDAAFVKLRDLLCHCATADLTRLSVCCHRWYLKPSTSETLSGVFHLHSTSASRVLSVVMDGQQLKHGSFWCTWAWHWSKHSHTKSIQQKTATKLKSRICLLYLLLDTTWGASASTLHTSALALCYSVALCCCPIWARSYTKLVNSQLNNSICLLNSHGCLYLVT